MTKGIAPAVGCGLASAGTARRRAAARAMALGLIAGLALASTAQAEGPAGSTGAAPATRPVTPPAPVTSPSAPLASARTVGVPNYWDPRQRAEKPEFSGLRVIRFLTDDDYPPLQFTTEDGRLTGFNVELARALCDVLRVACTVQARRWDTLLTSLKEARGDAVIASVRITPTLRASFGFSQAYLRTPGRFVGAKGQASGISPAALAGKSVAVVAGSAHEAYLRAFFPKADIQAKDTLETAQDALRAREVAFLFGDGLTLSLWLNGPEGSGCCEFTGGPYTESHFFGEGVGIATRPEDVQLRRALDYGLQRLAETGAFTELYLQFFPVSFY